MTARYLVADVFDGLASLEAGSVAIGIDLDRRNAELAMQRVGPFMLEVDELPDLTEL